MKIIKVIALIVLFNCQGNSTKKDIEDLPNPEYLIYSAEDYSVQVALENDSIYYITESYLKNVEDATTKEAEELIQTMIDEKLLPIPRLAYYQEGKVISKKFTYVDFKKYIEYIKDSVAKQPAYTPPSWQ